MPRPAAVSFSTPAARRMSLPGRSRATAHPTSATTSAVARGRVGRRASARIKELGVATINAAASSRSSAWAGGISRTSKAAPAAMSRTARASARSKSCRGHPSEVGTMTADGGSQLPRDRIRRLVETHPTAAQRERRRRRTSTGKSCGRNSGIARVFAKMSRMAVKKCPVFPKRSRGVVVSPYSFEGVTEKCARVGSRSRTEGLSQSRRGRTESHNEVDPGRRPRRLLSRRRQVWHG